MKNKILPIVLGIIVGFVVIRLFDFFSHEFYDQDVLSSLPEPTKENREEYMQALSEMIAKLPMVSLVLVMTGWLVAGFVGGAVAAKLTKGNWKKNALTVGFILFLATLSNILIIPHPLWMTIIGLSGIVPLAYLGGLLIGEKITLIDENA
jgi:uncharacterized membrane-anchored protein YhcB (DUF1043 family)